MMPSVDIVGIVTRSNSNFNADFCSLIPIAKRCGIPFFVDSKNNQNDMEHWIKSRSPDIVYCFGWSYLLKKEILSLPKLGVIGYHPTALPKNRGRHPIIWALALGLTETASSFFIMDEGADSGDLISQKKVIISNTDNAASLYSKLTSVALKQVETFTSLLASGKIQRIPQDHTQSNYWRKRTKLDGKIDWRMSTKGIYNLVRALAKPYPGAHCEYNSNEIKIWGCKIILNDHDDLFISKFAHIEHGRVVSSSVEGIDIRCGNGVIRLTQHEFSELPLAGVCL
ncbi:formyltransferase family protein [Cylindrospermopsis raciborskii G7]|uniref:formyltransferase family protein n=1 Tax=Cylindrospermopsis raciborskii TaxID=77022 RepID=UPI003879DE95